MSLIKYKERLPALREAFLYGRWCLEFPGTLLQNIPEEEMEQEQDLQKMENKGMAIVKVITKQGIRLASGNLTEGIEVGL